MKATVHEDGTATLTIFGTAAQVTAAADRVEKGAREARGLGDPRNLGELRAALALSLVLHSGLALPDPLPEDADDLVRTAWTEQMRTVLAALPPAVLNVIVPFDALVHSPQRPLFGPGSPDAANPGEASSHRPLAATAAGDASRAGPAVGDGLAPAVSGSPPQGGAAPPGGGGQTEVLSMGMVTGAFPQFLTPDAVRELALTPGTTLYRLLMDPADGRCVERSIAAYAPDAAMRAQVHAADVTCRAPGCVKHAPYTQLDHVIAYGAGGPTSETNLQDLDTRHHDGKTHGGWEAVMAPNRDVTWTSLLGRIYRTRAHDYRQYSTLFRAAVDRVHAETEQALADDAAAHAQAKAQGRPGTVTDGRGDTRARTPLTRQAAQADAVDRAIYRALTYRPPARPLRSGDDYPDTDTDPAFLGWDIITLTHTTDAGQRRYGPDPTTAKEERDAQQATAAPGEAGSSTADAAGSSTADAADSPTADPPGSTTTDKAGTTGDSPGTGWRHNPDDEPPPF